MWVKRAFYLRKQRVWTGCLHRPPPVCKNDLAFSKCECRRHVCAWPVACCLTHCAMSITEKQQLD